MAGIAHKITGLLHKQPQPGYQSAPNYQQGAYGYPRMTPDQKAMRFEQKAAQYQAQGNLAKAQKNREKALQYRARLQPGYVAPQVPHDRHTNKIAKLEQKALMYEQKGNTAKAMRSRQRAQRIRTKYGLGTTTGFAGTTTGFSSVQTTQTTFVGGAPMMAGGAVQHQTIVKPAIVQETIRTDRIVEVQPVIHREVDQTTVHHIEKHITEAAAPNRGGVVQMAPIVQETIRPQVIDEITPVIHRQIATTQVERVEEHIGERVVAPTQHTHQVTYENRPGVVGIVTGYQVGTFGYTRVPRDQKAVRFEQKALRYEQQGNLEKARKNREKALRYRQYTQPGYVHPQVTPQQRQQKLQMLQNKANLYNQRGNPQKATLANQRAARLRAKYGL